MEEIKQGKNCDDNMDIVKKIHNLLTLPGEST